MGTTAYSQGTIGFANNPLVPVIDSTTGMPAAVGSLTVGLYYSTDLSAVPDASVADDGVFTLLATTGIALPGTFNGGAVAVPGVAAGGSIVVQIRAWSTAFSSYADALNNGGASDLAGASILLPAAGRAPFVLGGGAIPPPNLVIQGGLTSFSVTPIPEPSVVALGILGGLGAMVLLRRRK